MIDISVLDIFANMSVAFGDVFALLACGLAFLTMIQSMIQHRDPRFMQGAIVSLIVGFICYYARVATDVIDASMTNGILLPMNNTMMLLLLVAGALFLISRSAFRMVR